MLLAQWIVDRLSIDIKKELTNLAGGMTEPNATLVLILNQSTAQSHALLAIAQAVGELQKQRTLPRGVHFDKDLH
jgi:hypothetical protein